MVQSQEKSWLWFQSIARGEQPHSQWGHAWISSEMWCGQNQHLEFTLFLQWLVKIIVINEIIIPLRKKWYTRLQSCTDGTSVPTDLASTGLTHYWYWSPPLNTLLTRNKKHPNPISFLHTVKLHWLLAIRVKDNFKDTLLCLLHLCGHLRILWCRCYTKFSH